MRWFFALFAIPVAIAAVLGIDYGSEFTKSSLVAPNIPFDIILTSDSKRKDASGLVLKPYGQDIERVYGTPGIPLASRLADRALYFLKPLIGLSKNDPTVQEFLSVHPGLDLTSTDRDTISVKVGKTEFPVEEIAAMSFKEIRGRADALLSAKFGSGVVRDVALSVPGHYGMTQRAALADSVDLSGLSLISLVNDGVAVAVNYVSSRQFPEKTYFVVYDMGAESTSSTLFSVHDLDGTTSLIVEGFGSDSSLGGKQVTAALRDLLVERFSTQARLSTSDIRTPRVLSRLWREAERAKSVLSANSEVRVHIESLLNDKDLNTKVSRSELEGLAGHLIGRVAAPLETSLVTFDGEKLDVADLDSIILAGGGTRAPYVQQEIRRIGGDIISKNVNADEAAALGTTLRGVGVSGIFKSKALNVTDRSDFTYTISINGRPQEALFPRGSVLGSLKVIDFHAEEPSNITLYENGKAVVTHSLPLAADAAKLISEENDKKCIDEPVVEATLTLNPSGIVRLAEVVIRCHGEPKADKATDGENETQSLLTPPRITRLLSARSRYAGASPMSPADKQKYLYHLKAMDKADGDRLRKQTLHNELEGLLYRVRELAPEDGIVNELLSWLDDEVSPTVVQLTERLKQAKALFKKYSASPEATIADEPPANEPSEADEVKSGRGVALETLLDFFKRAGISTNTEQDDWPVEALKSATESQIIEFSKLVEKSTSLGPFQDALKKITKAILEDRKHSQAADNHEEL